MKTRRSNKSPGIRVTVEERTGFVTIAELEGGTSAWHSPLNIGDRITHVGTQSVKGKTKKQIHEMLCGVEGSSVEVRVDVRQKGSENVSGLCQTRKNVQRVVKLVRGAVVHDDAANEKESCTLQVQVNETQNCSGSLNLGLLCMPTEHIIYIFKLQKSGFSWEVQKRFSDFLAFDTKLRAKFGNKKLDLLLAESKLPGKAFLDKASQGLITKRKRRLEEYILALASHRAISRDDLFMNFLQFPDDLYSPQPATSAGQDLQSWEQESWDEEIEGDPSAGSKGQGDGAQGKRVREVRAEVVDLDSLGNRFDIFSHVTIRNAAEMLEKASASQVQHEIFGHCKIFILDHFEAVSRSEGFLFLPENLLKEILASDKLRAKEEIVYESVLSWMQAQKRREGNNPRRGDAAYSSRAHDDLLRLVRFPLMPSETLVLRVLHGKEAETLSLLRDLATEAVTLQAVPAHLRDRVKLKFLTPSQCMRRTPKISLEKLAAGPSGPPSHPSSARPAVNAVDHSSQHAGSMSERIVGEQRRRRRKMGKLAMEVVKKDLVAHIVSVGNKSLLDDQRTQGPTSSSASHANAFYGRSKTKEVTRMVTDREQPSVRGGKEEKAEVQTQHDGSVGQETIKKKLVSLQTLSERNDLYLKRLVESGLVDDSHPSLSTRRLFHETRQGEQQEASGGRARLSEDVAQSLIDLDLIHKHRHRPEDTRLPRSTPAKTVNLMWEGDEKLFDESEDSRAAVSRSYT
ncbi:hypothetical protein GUITHDRAFT_105701 [Guillardia theta CCMP2712]|uniref:PX domain-containing protein n=1 Tax=Guillardia theta (strain CCMP2712) TaxID=905079 RepID=L1JJ55_GUITC|nr:hypothetical protein GUITHDRAFT_105701 [Guillardia theta CCMP2712]EKX48558.1 hypothetical protein GUITHDRAFT_105701 [Guillardia theta CCMP2712]|eukprot:XP_005835538.1 hypothetical protein GUITHDRAFT_105701 [Guillardia theta CCMP2712]